MNLTAFYTIDLSTASACCEMSDLEIFVVASCAALRHTATMWWDTVMEATKILCNIRRRILSYRKQLRNKSMFKEIHDLQHQKYRLRSLVLFLFLASVRALIYLTRYFHFQVKETSVMWWKAASSETGSRFLWRSRHWNTMTFLTPRYDSYKTTHRAPRLTTTATYTC